MNPQLFDLLKKFDQLHHLQVLEKNPYLTDDLLQCFKELDSFYPLCFETKSSSIQTLFAFKNPILVEKGSFSNVKTHLAQNNIACVILAGGDGSRLGSSLPKGCLPLFDGNKKTLFEIHCSKILSLQTKLCIKIPLIILTSQYNYKITLDFFEKNHFFGLQRSSIEFIIQPHLPFFHQKTTYFKKNGTFASGPNGNGAIFRLLKNLMNFQPNLETFQIINIDNPLVYPIDLELLQTHLIEQNDVTLRCIPLSEANQNIGRLYEQEGKLSIIDYTDDASTQVAIFGSINIFAFSKKFILSICQDNLLPLHWVKKPILHEKDLHEDETISSYLKGEMFITDSIKFAQKTTCILSKPEDYFAPVKSFSGPGSLKESQEALQRKETFLNKNSKPFDPNLYYSPIDLQTII
jgi:UDP-N-acetylglucosamine/UDP-N-acetylgalactosamine diphosphorylase